MSEHNSKAKKLLKDIARNIAILLLAFVLSKVLIYNVASLPYFSQERLADFKISDFYDIASYNSGTIKCDSNIVIIGIDDSDRNDIGRILEIINDCDPCAIGLDVTFRQLSVDDSLLCLALQRVSDKLVFPVTGNIERARQKQDSLPSESYINIETLQGASAGNVSLTTSSGREVIRTFYTNTPLQTSFSVALAERKDPEATVIMRNRANKTEKIVYLGKDFYEYKDSEILEGQFNPLTLKDKIVLMGSFRDYNDVHVTPIDDIMAGVKIHAYSIATILDRKYTYSTPYWFNNMIAIIFSFVTICFYFALISRKKKYTGIVSQLIPILVILFFIYWGFDVYVKHLWYVDFSQSLVMIALTLIAIDIWVGGPSFIKDISSLIVKPIRNVLKI